MTAAAWIVALLSAYPHLQHRACVEARASQIAADADSAAARYAVPVGVLLAVAYAAIFLFAPAIVLVLLLGIVEPWTRLRERFAGPAPGL